MDEYSTEAGVEASGMKIVYSTPRKMRHFAAKGTPHELSREGRARLTWLQWHFAHGQNKALTCRHFGISRPTLNHWLARYEPNRLQALENRPSTPAHVRRPEWSLELVATVKRLREEWPRWGKKKLVRLLHRLGYYVSESTVGRILRHLKKTGQLKEAFATVH